MGSSVDGIERAGEGKTSRRSTKTNKNGKSSGSDTSNQIFTPVSNIPCMVSKASAFGEIIGPIAHAAWRILAPIIFKSIFNSSWTKEHDATVLVDNKVSSEGRGFILGWLQALGRVLPRGINTRAPKPIHPPPFFWR